MDIARYSAEERQALLPWANARIPVPPAPPGVPPGATAAPGGPPAPSAQADPHPAARTRERVRGMLLGLAIGDALGNTSEGLTPSQRRHIHGEVRDYLPNRREEMAAVGLPSDDTQLTFWTLESLLRRRGLDPADLADTFTRRDRIYGIGSTLTEFLFAYRFGGRRWFEAGRPSAGNGALMRIAPVILPHLRNMTRGLWVDVVAATVLTHRDEAAVSASAGFVGVLAECLAWPGEEAPVARWWPETFLRYARPVETGVRYRPRVPDDPFEGSLCDRVAQEVSAAVAAAESVLTAAGRWYSGACLLETVPCALHVLARHAGDPEGALVRAVNDTTDNDTIAAIVGAAVGALHGEGALPSRWRDGLLGRTREEDDGHVQELIDQAVEAFAA